MRQRPPAQEWFVARYHCQDCRFRGCFWDKPLSGQLTTRKSNNCCWSAFQRSITGLTDVWRPTIAKLTKKSCRRAASSHEFCLLTTSHSRYWKWTSCGALWVVKPIQSGFGWPCKLGVDALSASPLTTVVNRWLNRFISVYPLVTNSRAYFSPMPGRATICYPLSSISPSIALLIISKGSTVRFGNTAAIQDESPSLFLSPNPCINGALSTSTTSLYHLEFHHYSEMNENLNKERQDFKQQIINLQSI